MHLVITPSHFACSTCTVFGMGWPEFMDHVRDSGFLSQARRLQLLKAETPAQALDLLDEAAKNAAQGVIW